ncbi:MAG: hypothetical protein GTO41_03325 [Burkholderiales bacterium]|nr:hypothetical protein [Burkholderiales bacterium]
MKLLVTAILFAGVISTGQAGPEQRIDVARLAFTPGIDGDLREWQAFEPYRIAIAPAVEDDERNRTGSIEVELWIGRSENEIYVGARWPDTAADTDFRPWQWRGGKYRRSKQRDDMFALRFELSGEYNRSMIADANYVVDVWVWSAGRSNRIGSATDYRHRISLSMIEDAPEYETESGNTVYIDRILDAGETGFRTIKPGKSKTETRVPSLEVTAATGSAADVAAAGNWRDGHWTLELRRALDTGHADDVRFYPGLEILGQIAVFNRIGGQHKSVSEPLLFRIN